MDTAIVGQIEHDFLALPQVERQTIISYGAALRLADLRKRLFLAESKVRYFEDKYHTHLARLDTDGLPDDAGVELHEDYVMWHHWAAVADQVRNDIAALQGVVFRGLYMGDLARVGY
ncbi:MAG: hypothetical protein CVU38_07230 [Chloroflexi bacterium HGW-Chloroflexi-1]|nr:MAG: hypothetical protein CVU38_07230 [Chloroflexi bacterium HGW-Chloroflexi-1]